MATATLLREVRKLRQAMAPPVENAALTALRQDPANLMTLAGITPDPWQAALLRESPTRTLLLCSRQAGKSLTAAALSLKAALLEPPALVLLVSRTQDQSAELFRDKVLRLYDGLGRPVPAERESALTLTLTNGSRIISLPNSEPGIRGYSGVSLLVFDEAARVPDDLYRATRPMLAVSKGRLLALSTPFGKRGWFYEEWESERPWRRVRITADRCPRIPPEFLEEERLSLGERWFRQEYDCSFEEAVGAVFSHDDVLAALSDDLQPLFVG